MADRPDGDSRRPTLDAGDDWFSTPIEKPGTPAETLWEDEPWDLPSRPPADQNRRIILAVLALVALGVVIVAAVMIAGGFRGSGSTHPAPRTTTLNSTTPTRTGPTPTTPATPSTTTTMPTSVPTDAVLQTGNSGASVKALQQALSALGYAPGKADGRFGAATMAAVAAFQKAHGRPQDSLAGPKTLAAINQALLP